MTCAERQPRSNEAAIRAIARRQLGLVTTRQVAAEGMSASAVSRRVASGAWQRVLPGVLRDVMVEPSPAQSALAAVLWADDDALVSHAAAGALLGLDGVTVRVPEIWVPPGRRLRSGFVVVHRGTVDATDRRMVGVIPVTSPARTLVDLAGVLDDEALAAAVEDAVHRGLTTPLALARRLDALGGKGRPGTSRLRRILDDRGAGVAADSRLEVRIWRTLRAVGLAPVRQHPVRVAGRTYRVDLAFPEARLAVEGIGDRYHRSPLHRQHDQRRLADLASVAWTVLPVTWNDVTDDPTGVVDRVRRALAARA